MQHHHPIDIAIAAVAPRDTAPGMAVMHDSDDVRILVFRIDPGQAVAPHTSPSTVVLTILQGDGEVLGGDGAVAVRAGDVISFTPRELHGMRATDQRLVVMATISPRPGSAR